MPILARIAAVAANLGVVAGLVACGSHPDQRASAPTNTIPNSYPPASQSVPKPTGSGDPLYDKYAAAMTAAGIAFIPGITGNAWASYPSDTSLCKKLRSGDDDAYELKWFWMTEPKGDAARRVPAMIPILCPDQQGKLDEALGPNPKMTKFSGSNNFVGNGQNCESCGVKIQPGTYSTGQVKNCYWARLDSQGNIIANNMVSLSQSVVVTIEATDAAFESNNCGEWTRVD